MRALALLVSLALALAIAPARAASATVVVRNNVFEPTDLHVDPGDAVTWAVLEGQHSATSSHGVWDSGVLTAGQSFTFTFEEEGRYPYVCRVHGGSMRGSVTVGDPPEEDRPAVVVKVATSEELTAAVAQAGAGSEIWLAPGVYPLRSSLLVTAPELTIEGRDHATGDALAADAVVLRASGAARYAIEAAADDVRIAHLSVEGFRAGGIAIRGVQRFSVADIVASGNALEGIAVSGVHGGAIADVVVLGGTRAGIAIHDCPVCGVLVERAHVEGAFVGLDIERASGLVVRDSTFEGNGSGIVVRTPPAGAPPLAGGVQIVHNTIARSGDPAAAHPNTAKALEQGRAFAGAAVWVAGGAGVDVEGNVVREQAYGVAVTAFGAPPADVRVVANTIDASSIADVGWDGSGARVCFQDNAASSGEAASTDPPLLDTTGSCDMPATASAPAPVLPRLALRFLEAYG